MDAYVRHLDPVWGVGPVRVTDPGWASRPDVDVFHLYDGHEGSTPRQAEALVAVVRRRRTPFVLTVRQLRDPHGTLDALVPAADAVVTLTPGAAREIRGRWQRDAMVLPHPHVVDLRDMAVAQDCRARRRTGTFRVGLVVDRARGGSDAERVRPAVTETVAGLPDAELVRVDGDDLHALWCALTSVDLAVLPERLATHSTLLEACRDLGATVVAPLGGYLPEQGPMIGYVDDETSYEPGSLAAAISSAYETRPSLGASIDERCAQRQAVAGAHEELYRSLLR